MSGTYHSAAQEAEASLLATRAMEEALVPGLYGERRTVGFVCFFCLFFAGIRVHYVFFENSCHMFSAFLDDFLSCFCWFPRFWLKEICL